MQYEVTLDIHNPHDDSKDRVVVPVEAETESLAKAEAIIKLIDSAYQSCGTNNENILSIANEYFHGDVKKARQEVSQTLAWDFINNSKVVSIKIVTPEEKVSQT
jgi:hypothetical protein